MAAKKQRPKRQRKPVELERIPSKFRQDITGLLLIAIAFFVFAANVSSSTGMVGLFLVKTLLRSVLGVGVLVLPLFIGFYGVILLLRHEIKELAVRLTGLLILFATYISIAQFFDAAYFADAESIYFQGAGGVLGFSAHYALTGTVGLWGSYIILCVLGVIGSLMIFNVTVLDLFSYIWHLFVPTPEVAEVKPEEKKGKAVQLPLPATKPVPVKPEVKIKEELPPPPPIIINSTISKEEDDYIKGKKHAQVTIEKEPRVISEKINVMGEFKLPPLDLLEDPTEEERVKARGMSEQINSRKEQLEQSLRSFGVGARVVAIFQGPAVTRYELQPEPGVKVSRFHAITNDISLAMAAQGIRIEAPVPGKSVVGIEVPNPYVTPVRLKEIAESSVFQGNKSKLAFCLGKDLGGHPIIGDLTKMPHLLIAGTTGSGKSVCLNSLITSILLRATPQDVRMIMIDPKMVELSNFNGIAHLLAPVVTNVKKAAMTLKVWVIQEMTRRFEIFHGTGARDIEAYNLKQKKAEDRLPRIVVIVDELADMMMVAANEVEASICRIAQMARATGIHMVIATQRPSVDVITGLIKANIPSRIAFAVATQIDSRVILDSSGAEKLLGRGDMLYSPIGSMKPMRLQGAFVTDPELESVIDFIKKQGEAEYIEEIQTIKGIDLEDKGNQGESGEGRDELFDDVAKLVVNSGKASTSYVQRKFSIGYNRAARVMDQLEEAGIVSAPEGEQATRRVVGGMDIVNPD